MKYFVVSDVHGQFNQMIIALADAGFEARNENHTLITLGDMFDRGPKSKEIYHYLISLDRVINIHGNHDKFLMDFLAQPFNDKAFFNAYHNGVAATYASLANITKTKALRLLSDDPQYLAAENNKHNKGIYRWLMDMPLYHETETHILVHAGLSDDTTKDWRNSTYKEFTWQHDFMLKYTDHIDKTIVFGHMHAWRNRYACDTKIGYYDSIAEKRVERGLVIPDASTFYFENKVSIDGCSNMEWGVVNVYIFEE